MKKLIIVLVLVVVISGCQLDFQGPSMSAKVIRKGENDNKEFLSRGSGMTGGNGYSAGGNSFFAWGNNRNQDK